ncbi:hypothetical protein CBR_g34842 [Chara braunii]|uniref:Uncharacterized protein n=1 Tax=Chara braunii TaxID=69332 RepID=A0A388LJG8_CHABU|nr:hypothetical protein CBR_g34842 [Chara braunii]|eukprot:GBG82466.1 hypothetical protein CBR_g34842 [Chara braunii]
MFRELPPDAQAAGDVDPMTEVRYETQAEATVLQPDLAGMQGEAAVGPGTSAELHGEAAGGGDDRAETGGGTIVGVPGEAEGLHVTALTTPGDPRPVPDQRLHDRQRTKDAFLETEEIPLGLEDIQTGQSMGVDDDTTLARAEDDGGAGARQEVIGTPDRGRHEASRSLVVRIAVGPVVRHEEPFPIDPMRPAGGVASIVERRIGRGMCAPPIPRFAPSRERTQSRYVPHPRGTLPFDCMTAEELEAHGTMDYTGIDTGRPDLSWAPTSPSLPSGGSIAVPSQGGAGPLSRGSADVQPHDNQNEVGCSQTERHERPRTGHDVVRSH